MAMLWLGILCIVGGVTSYIVGKVINFPRGVGASLREYGLYSAGAGSVLFLMILCFLM